MSTGVSRRLLAISFAIIMVASFVAARVQTASGTIQLTEVRIPAQNGQWVTGDLFASLVISRTEGYDLEFPTPSETSA